MGGRLSCSVHTESNLLHTFLAFTYSRYTCGQSTGQLLFFFFFFFCFFTPLLFQDKRTRIDMTQSNLTYIHVIFSVRYPLHCSFPCTLPCATFLSLPLPFRFLSIRFFLYLNHPFLPLSLSPPLSLPPATWLPHRRFRRGFRCCCVGVP